MYRSETFPIGDFIVRARAVSATTLFVLCFWNSIALGLDLEPDFRRPEDYFFDARVSVIQDGNSNDWQHDALLTGPVFRNDENVVALTLNGHDVHLPATQNVPNLLSERLLGASYYHHGDSDHVQGVILSVGSASDQVFAGSDVNVVSITGLIRYPSSTPHRGWVLLLNLSNDRPAFQTAPVPGVVYFISNPEGTSITAIGFPFFQYQSQVFRRTHMNVIVFPWAYDAQVTYSFFDNLLGVIHTGWLPRVYFQHDRPDLSQRMFYDEKVIDAGIRLNVASTSLKSATDSFVEIGAGCAFDRSFYRGESIYQINGGRQIIPASGFVKVTAQLGL